MSVRGHRAISFAPSKEIRDDETTQKQYVETKIKAAEEINDVILVNAAQREIVRYITDKNAQRDRGQPQE
jgi:hypothetical protein